MKPERWKQIEQLYEAALKLDLSRRDAFLDEACAGDEGLRREVASLLASDGRAGSFLRAPATDVMARSVAAEGAASHTGRQLGHYQVLSLIGAGGMGEIYLARDTRLGRKIALKLLPLRFTRDVERLRRFEREARAASALNHPNIITIHEIGESGELHFIATEFVEGKTLREKMEEARIPVPEALEVATQVAGALQAAHDAGILHRDIKPENVMVRSDGYVKVLDFGLAKLTEPATAAAVDPQAPTGVGNSTEAGVVMGTPSYMSPEQARGEKVDARTDVFSLGVMLYEMVAGRAPFAGETPSEVIAAILRDEPPPLTDQAPETPPEIERILGRALRKHREERYQTAGDLLADLKRLKRQLELKDELNDGRARADSGAVTRPTDTIAEQVESTGDLAPAQTRAKHRPGGLRRRGLIAVSALAVVVAGAGWLFWRGAKLKQARAALARVEDLAQAERFFEAYDLAAEAQGHLPNDPTLARLMRTIADDLSVVTDPPGAQVYLKRFDPDESGRPPARQLVGVTPISHRQIARGAYLVSVEKEGYANFERTVGGLLLRVGGMIAPSPPINLEAKLVETAQAPARMAFVPGGDYRLESWGRPTDKNVRLGAYFIDRYEVTNREYKEFMSAGGYLKREYWRRPFVKNGREVAWEEAIREFTDRTSLPGPRGWANQEFPEGKAEHPVTDISWHEAAAYAAFRGKELPTAFQWEMAARRRRIGGTNYYMMPWGPFTGTIERRANFNGPGTLPVESLEFGMSPYGCYHMAGNVAEWLRNEFSAGFTVTGGSWEDPPYLFGYFGPYPGTYSSGKLGFRCVLNAPGTTGDQGAAPLLTVAEVPVYTPVSDARFRAWQEHYRYAQPPLDAHIAEAQETDDWRREKITYVGAEGERAIAYLYLPKHYPPPW